MGTLKFLLVMRVFDTGSNLKVTTEPTSFDYSKFKVKSILCLVHAADYKFILMFIITIHCFSKMLHNCGEWLCNRATMLYS